jgi:UDP-N-acetylmuramoyl-L-alanyl-D-glutamate--2,6-diaminopimelate ligase
VRLEDVFRGCAYEISGERERQRGVEVQPLEAQVSGIAYDSRKVVKDTVFVAIRGEKLDGHDFISDAVKRGAVAIIHEKPEPNAPSCSDIRGPLFIKVRDTRRALACISNNFYERPSEGISVIGVTGTNGKTTTTYLIKSVLEAWGRNAGLIGTITYIIGDRHYPAVHTTPEALEFQGILREMAKAGCSHVITEVSSHSLSQCRVDYTLFEAGVFTNLTRDHLDFHGTMEEYYRAKRRLFTELLSAEGIAVINRDDAWGKRLLTDLREQGKERESRPSIITYGMERGSDVTALDPENTPSGVSFTLEYRGGSCRIVCPLVGIPNIYNILAAASVALALGIPTEVMREGIRNTPPVEGRLEKVEAGQDFLCIVDYAHTPDALERLIVTARELLKDRNLSGRIITLFGCGGDRDRGKRPLMGEIASRLSDYLILTSDNPRSEDPDEILSEIVSGISGDRYQVVPDRKEAITLAVEKAGPGDIVLIAGKGHEDYQEIKGVRYKFRDREVAEEAIKKSS